MATKKSTEEWRPVVGQDGRFAVSSFGRIVRLAPNHKRKEKGPYEVRCNLNHFGYPFFSTKNKSNMTVHAAVATAFLGPRRAGMTVNHIDGDKTNNAVSNLEYLSIGDNIRHARRLRGNWNAKGSSHGVAKLAESDIRAIRKMRLGGDKLRDIASTFGISQSNVCFIVKRQTWTHVD